MLLEIYRYTEILLLCITFALTAVLIFGKFLLSQSEADAETSIVELPSGVRYRVDEVKEEEYIPPDTTATTRTNYTFLTEDSST